MRRRIMLLILTLVILTQMSLVVGIQAAAVNSAEELNDGGIPGAFGFGEDEAYAIVPIHAGSSAIDQNVSSGQIILFKAHRNSNQCWRLVRNGDYYYIESAANGKVIEVPNANATDGVQLSAGVNSRSDKQLWKLKPAGDGTYYICSKLKESSVIDINGISSSDGAVAMLNTINYGPNQRFRFVHITTAEPMSDWGAGRNDCTGSDWDMWDGSSDNSWFYSNRNAQIYYIDSARALAGVSQLVRDRITDFNGKTIVLRRDIDLCGIEWRKIGAADYPFRGSFNGNGHSIAGLSITTTESENGFFGYVHGGSITDFAIRGSVSGDFNTGGVVGNMARGHIVNVYSEVSLTRATDDNEGGICGRLGYEGYIEHCTQNARVNSGDQDPDRGGIAGYCSGVIRYCVNLQTVDCNWNYVGGICGECAGGKVEYCANYGQVGGGGDTERAGGICGMVKDDGLIFACYNAGYIYSTDDDCIGGICGRREGDGKVLCCINIGSVRGDDYIGGVVGYGWCRYCFNAGQVDGDDEVGAVSGSASRLDWCRALSWTSARLHGDGDNIGAEWISAEDVIGGKLCCDLNRRENQLDLNGYGPGFYTVFYQNLGGDPFPSFSGQTVSFKNNKYVNDSYEVRAEYSKSYGTVTGAGSYSSGEVTLTAQPADGCVFDHYEVSRTSIGTKAMYQGSHNYPGSETQTYTNATLRLTDNINRSYNVKAVFTVFDDTPEDLKQSVRIELECVDDTDGWNSATVPIYLIDSAGERHLWEVNKDDLDGEGKKVTHTFDLGTASPISVEAWPDFGGGFTFHDLGLKARMWINDSGSAIESEKVMIRSYPFISSKYNNDYMYITFDDSGNSSVGLLREDGTIDVKGTYTTCSEAWNAAGKLGKNAVIRLESAWLTTDVLSLSSGEFTLDLNGYPIIRSLKKTQKNGAVVGIESGATLNIIDSTPIRRSCSAFSGGSIQGGRSTNSGGLIEVRGTLNMKGGALYNGGTTDVGGAIRCDGGTVNLENTMISDCWSNKAWFSDNNGGGIAIRGGKVNLKGCTIRNCTANEKGGAIHMNGSGTELNLTDTGILACTASDDEGGAIYQDSGSVNYRGGAVQNCRSVSDDGGAVYQNNGKLYCQDVQFENNDAENNGGAICINTDDPTWLVRCTLKGNQCGDYGGAVYLDDDYLYLEDSAVTANAAGNSGGGIYLNDSGSIDVYGRVVVEGNDGSGTMDNLVMEDGAYIYDQGLTDGSSIHLRSTKDSEVKLSGGQISRYQIDKYFVSDYTGGLKLTEQENVRTALVASAFTEGRYIILIGGGIIVLAAAAILVRALRKRKGEDNEK